VTDLAKRLQVEMPICATVVEVLNGKLTVEQGVQALMGRQPKAES
jgi:glycerol-3-phosphate dehydrogenase (NAD(P)+)